MRKVLNDFGETKSEERLKILDVAGGTGDISFRILNKAKKDAPGCKIISNLRFYRALSRYNSL